MHVRGVSVCMWVPPLPKEHLLVLMVTHGSNFHLHIQISSHSVASLWCGGLHYVALYFCLRDYRAVWKVYLLSLFAQKHRLESYQHNHQFYTIGTTEVFKPTIAVNISLHTTEKGNEIVLDDQKRRLKLYKLHHHNFTIGVIELFQHTIVLNISLHAVMKYF